VQDPEPPALGVGLRSIAVRGEPLGDIVEAALAWDGSPPAPTAAAAIAGLPLIPEVTAVRSRVAAAATAAAAAGSRPAVDSRAASGLGAELGELGSVEKLGVESHRGQVAIELEADKAVKARPEDDAAQQDDRR
jgi:hypothetical protein